MRYEITAVDTCGFKWLVREMRVIDGNWHYVGWEKLFHTLAEVGAYINEQEESKDA